MTLYQEYVLNDALFRVFDEDRSGTLNFFEWYQATNVKNMSTIEEKLDWIFTAFVIIITLFFYFLLENFCKGCRQRRLHRSQ